LSDGAAVNDSALLNRGHRKPYQATKRKHSIGTAKPRDMFDWSAMKPISFGRRAPPMIAITMNEDAFLAREPSPWMPSAKIVGNMIDMKK